MTLMDIKAITVYFELGLVHPDLQGAFIKQEYGKEDKFWEALEATGLELPYVNYSST